MNILTIIKGGESYIAIPTNKVETSINGAEKKF